MNIHILHHFHITRILIYHGSYIVLVVCFDYTMYLDLDCTGSLSQTILSPCRAILV